MMVVLRRDLFRLAQAEAAVAVVAAVVVGQREKLVPGMTNTAETRWAIELVGYYYCVSRMDW